MKQAIVMILLTLATKAVAQQVRVMVQVIEVPHRELTKWTTGEKLSGPELHDRAVKLALSGGGEILDTNMLIVRSGEKALHESIAEMIYPTEYDLDGLGATPSPLESEQPFVRPLRPMDFLAFETRNVGTTVEIEPTVSNDNTMVDLRLSYEMLDRDSLMTWTEFRDQWGDASIRRPIFETKRLSSALTLVPGKFELFNIFTPKPAAVPAAVTRQMVFVKADVISPPKP